MRTPPSILRLAILLGLVIALVIALSACTRAATPGATSTSGPGATATPPQGDAIHLAGRVTAGPVCPVERIPPDPSCAPRSVAGATLVVTGAGGAEVARTKSAADGSFAIDLPAGDYTLVPQPVEGLMGTAPSIEFSVRLGGPQPAPFDVQYDTGIR